MKPKKNEKIAYYNNGCPWDKKKEPKSSKVESIPTLDNPCHEVPALDVETTDPWAGLTEYQTQSIKAYKWHLKDLIKLIAFDPYFGELYPALEAEGLSNHYGTSWGAPPPTTLHEKVRELLGKGFPPSQVDRVVQFIEEREYEKDREHREEVYGMRQMAKSYRTRIISQTDIIADQELRIRELKARLTVFESAQADAKARSVRDTNHRVFEED
jgi:hypothetical protein